MNILTKSLLSAGAAAAALVSVAVPAQARDRRDNDRIGAGEVIAGAVILGGLAAVIASSDNNRGQRYDDPRYDDRRYDDGRAGRDDYDYGRSGYGNANRNGGGRAAVNQCVNAVETWSNRYSRSDVTQIRDIDRTRGGYRVSGNLVVKDGWRGQNRGQGRYDRDDRYGNRQGYARGYDKGRFTCYVERGRVVDIDYSGLEQWR
ncbi:MAG: hypothetical protein WBO17_07025 [Sphingorhabdus sp.]